VAAAGGIRDREIGLPDHVDEVLKSDPGLTVAEVILDDFVAVDKRSLIERAPGYWGAPHGLERLTHERHYPRQDRPDAVGRRGLRTASA
jgi:hypothetical protein